MVHKYWYQKITFKLLGRESTQRDGTQQEATEALLQGTDFLVLAGGRLSPLVPVPEAEERRVSSAKTAAAEGFQGVKGEGRK